MNKGQNHEFTMCLEVKIYCQRCIESDAVNCAERIAIHFSIKSRGFLVQPTNGQTVQSTAGKRLLTTYAWGEVWFIVAYRNAWMRGRLTLRLAWTPKAVSSYGISHPGCRRYAVGEVTPAAM